MTNGPDDKVGQGERVSAVLIRADGTKTRIEHGTPWRKLINWLRRAK